MTRRTDLRADRRTEVDALLAAARLTMSREGVAAMLAYRRLPAARAR